jgi:hypothetical protein
LFLTTSRKGAPFQSSRVRRLCVFDRAMEQATSRLLPMLAHGFEERKRDAAAQG